MRFEPLRPDRVEASFDDLSTYLDDLPPLAYQSMAAHALARVHRDLGIEPPDLRAADPVAWRRALEPGLTTAAADEALPLVVEPLRLKEQTLALFRGIWERTYRAEYAARLPDRRAAARLASPTADRGVGLAFADLTGNRPPAALVAQLSGIERVAFCPSAHLGTFVSYILYPPDLIVFFGAPELLARSALGAIDRAAPTPPPSGAGTTATNGLDEEALLDALRAAADPTRLRILDLLGGGELYAQEIVGRLGITQSAVSRHLAQLERADLVLVRPRGGMKYYAQNGPRLDGVADAFRTKARGRQSA